MSEERVMWLVLGVVIILIILAMATKIFGKAISYISWF